ncbi:MAG: cytochrome c family protein [Alphaproteobacteria bacterium]
MDAARGPEKSTVDGFEVNKFLGAILGTALLIVALRNITDAVFEKEPLEKNAYPVAVAGGADGGGGGAAPAALDIPKLLAAANADRGGRVAEKCLSCHTFAKGAPNSTGPNLWGVVGSHAAHLGAAFDYSSAMRKVTDPWTYERLFAFLENPSAFVPGTKMTFAGLSRPTDRADVIAYMRTQSDSPPPLPELKEAPPAPEGGATPGGGEAAPAGMTPAAPGPAPAATGTTPAPAGQAPAQPEKKAPPPHG